MTVKTYERIGQLISNIKRSKHTINRNNCLIDRDFKELNALLKQNDQPGIKLEDINPTCYGEEWDDEI